MKTLSLALFLALICSYGFAQNKAEADSLIRLLPTLPNDTNKVWMLEKIANIYGNFQIDLGKEYAQKGLDLAQKLQFKKGELMCLSRLGAIYSKRADYAKTLDYQIKALKIAETIHYKIGIRKALGQINATYRNAGYYDLALVYNFKILKFAEEFNDNIPNALRGTGETYFYLNRLDSALYYTIKAYTMVKKDNIAHNGAYPIQLGFIYSELGNYTTAIKYFQEGISYSIKANVREGLAITYNGVASVYQKLGKMDSCIFFAEKALAYATEQNSFKNIKDASTLLASVYDSIAPLKALKYYRLAASTNDSLFNNEKLIQFHKLNLEEQRRQQAIEAEKELYNNLLWQYGLMLGLLFMGVITFILFRNNQHKQKTNQQLQQQKDQIERTLTQLKSTQNQLIQKEKLASLGELTAGIAHEIQNPLNFVNNFSEMSVELINEIKSPLIEASNRPEGGMIDIKSIDMELFDDVVQNLSKINLHGKRASSIVSGMLEHSRTSTGERALTDLNKLADEYLRLSYHGMRAKDNSFSADYELIADGNLPKINIVPQDIGRVLLNLINNAFWAVRTVAKPKVIISTLNDSIASSDGIVRKVITIKVIDNGIGMSKEVQVKIFQPFFTTKPTGQGTGLGLSLAYDIVTKGHGGTIEVESVEGEGTTFIVKLPIL